MTLSLRRKHRTTVRSTPAKRTAQSLAVLSLLAVLASTATAAEPRTAPEWSPVRRGQANQVQTAQYQRQARAPQQRNRSTPVDDPFADPFAAPSGAPRQLPDPLPGPAEAPSGPVPQRIVSEPLLAQPLDDDRPPAPNAPRGKRDQEPCRPFNSLKNLRDISLSIDAKDEPPECTLDDEPFYWRNWEEKCYPWKASALCSKPLYFEDERLERYGMMRRPALQPIVSGARFFGSAALLPYKMGVEHPFECVYALGHFRPGSCVPKHRKRIFPLNRQGVINQAAAVAGLIVLVP